MVGGAVAAADGGGCDCITDEENAEAGGIRFKASLVLFSIFWGLFIAKRLGAVIGAIEANNDSFGEDDWSDSD